MKTNQNLINPSNLADETELTEDELKLLDLSKLPKKIRVGIRRNDGFLQVQHVGKKLHLKLLIDFVFSSKTDYQEQIHIAEQALLMARCLLDRDRLNDPVYGDVDNGELTVLIADSCSGAEALAALDKSVTTLVDRANALLEVVAHGIKTIEPADQDWW